MGASIMNLSAFNSNNDFEKDGCTYNFIISS